MLRRELRSQILEENLAYLDDKGLCKRVSDEKQNSSGKMYVQTLVPKDLANDVSRAKNRIMGADVFASFPSIKSGSLRSKANLLQFLILPDLLVPRPAKQARPDFQGMRRTRCMRRASAASQQNARAESC